MPGKAGLKVEREVHSAQQKAGEIFSLTYCETAAIFPEQGRKSSRRSLFIGAGFHSYEPGSLKQVNVF